MNNIQYKKSDFFYYLPEEQIAQTPATPRDSSRLLVYNRDLDMVEHKTFRDIKHYLKSGDVLVVNDTKVLPARIFAKTANGGTVEVLLLKRLEKDKWEVLVKPGKKCKPGVKLTVNNKLSLTVEGVTDSGERIINFEYDGVFEEILDEVGSMPLPPYIKEKLQDKNRYQTVYAQNQGSAAAPTAGLHFTPELLEEIKNMGVHIAKVTLNVGLGTFRPVKEDIITNHKMHSEFYQIGEEAASIINAAKKEGRRIIAVGTTSVRTLESAADENGEVKATSGDTQIFIYPPYKFKCVNALITNFHLPESTLIMLVSALSTREKILQIYNLAVAEKYRFFSFGDAMFII
ncbi:MAG: tRNA preQ1(34) S-adenosylmethionine ribosyltransferase-isomerase QueA [Clostridia bacterium]|nr:tRNA preQ1(34) S-adenosylmethionine ribosyltransferase-isomerase QueA [Clostridia bacterium]